MNRYKLLTYTAGENVPRMINNMLAAEYKDQTAQYLIFSQTDIIDLANNQSELCNAYCNFLDTWKVPFGFYSYYGRFNSVLPESANRPNPRLVLKTKYGKCDLISQFAYGFIIINVETFKNGNIKLDETYPAIFYIQDLAEQCFQKNLWLSNCYYIDIHESWKMFKEHKNNGYNINIKDFQEEKERYNKQPRNYGPIQEFLDRYKVKLHEDDNKVQVESNESGIIDITKLVENQ